MTSGLFGFGRGSTYTGIAATRCYFPNQTQQFRETNILLENTYVASLPSPLTGHFDIANTSYDPSHSGYWASNGTPNYWTTDGTHGSSSFYSAVVSNNAIPSSTFNWP